MTRHDARRESSPIDDAGIYLPKSVREEERRQLRFVAIVCLVGGGVCCLWSLTHLVVFLRFVRQASTATAVIQNVRWDAGNSAAVWRFESPDGRAHLFEQAVSIGDASEPTRWWRGQSARVAYNPSDPVGTAVLADFVLSDDSFYALLGASILGLGIGLRWWEASGRHT